MSGNGSKPLSIGSLAKQAGVNLETLRFYERRGLLPEPPRTKSGYRMYPSEAVKRLRFIKRAQELGFSLDEVEELLALQLSPRGTSAQVKRRSHEVGGRGRAHFLARILPTTGKGSMRSLCADGRRRTASEG